MITVTEQAAGKIKMNIVKRGRGIGIKVGVKTTGCSGLAYVFEYVDEMSEQLTLVPGDHNVNIFVERDHLQYLGDITIDYVRRGLNEGFDISNSLEKARCGCGESFTV